ncbi:hypothetical protein [Reyranella sp.]|uniref:hypothetical protein n=1 Tax=Reyranella sp. TaxID=1929291 RepID=UPI003BABD341
MISELPGATSIGSAFGPFRFNQPVRRRIMGRWRILLLASPVLAVVLVVIGLGVAMEVRGVPGLAVIVLFLTLAFGLNNAARRFVDRKMRQEWQARGAPTQTVMTVSVRTDGLLVESAVGTVRFHWPFISELMPVKDCWILFVPVSALAIRRASFHSEAEERAFLEAVLGHLEPSARARSARAEAVMAGLPSSN